MERGMRETGTSAYMTVGEFAEHLGVSRPTVYRLLHEGALVSFKVGCQWRIDADRSVELLSADDTARETRAI